MRRCRARVRASVHLGKRQALWSSTEQTPEAGQTGARKLSVRPSSSLPGGGRWAPRARLSSEVANRTNERERKERKGAGLVLGLN